MTISSPKIDAYGNELKDVLLVPNRAVRMEDGKRVVYILGEDTLNSVEISLGTVSGAYSEVVGGDLEEGDLIVLDPPAEKRGLPGFPSP